MENKYPILAEIIQNEFSHVLGTNRDKGIDFLISGINKGCYNIDEIRKEYDQAILDTSYDWIDFAIRYKMHWDQKSYSNLDIINYIKYYFSDVLYPESKISDKKFEIVLNTALKILRNRPLKNRWINIDELHKCILKETHYVDLPFFIMYKLMISNDFRVNGKSIRGKGKQIILLKIAD